MNTVISTSGNFQMIGQSIVFVGTVWIADEDGNELDPITGEHGEGDYNWGSHWNIEN